MGLKKYVVSSSRPKVKTTGGKPMADSNFSLGSRGDEDKVISPIYLTEESFPCSPIGLGESMGNYTEKEELVIDYENLEDLEKRVKELSTDEAQGNSPSFGHEYYEGILFGDGQPQRRDSISSLFSEKIINPVEEDYEEVEVNQFFDPVTESLGLKPSPEYENYNRKDSPKETIPKDDVDLEAMFSVGRRFPSIRIKSETKKFAKKKQIEPLYSSPEKKKRQPKDVESKNIEESGSCPRPAYAIYDPIKVTSKPSSARSVASTLQRILSPVSSSSQEYLRPSLCCHQWHCNRENIYEESSQRKSIFLSTPFLCSVILLSVLVFIIAGAILLYHSREVKSFQPESSTNSLQSYLSLPIASTHLTTSATWAEWTSWSTCSPRCLPGESHARTRGCSDSNGGLLRDLDLCLAKGGYNVDIRSCQCPNIITAPATPETSTTPLTPTTEASETSSETYKYYFKI